jgi:hypothetical protein
MTTSFPSSLDSFSNPTSIDSLSNPSHAGQHANVNDAVEALQAKVGVDSSAVATSLDYKVSQLETNSVTLSGSATLTNKTLSAPIINDAVLKSTKESWSISNTAISGTVNLNVLTSSAWIYTNGASNNWTLNISDGNNTFGNSLSVGDSMTVVLAVTLGGVGYYCDEVRIDDLIVYPEWQGDVTPSSGNANSTDVYIFTIIKTNSAPSYTILASQTQFA